MKNHVGLGGAGYGTKTNDDKSDDEKVVDKSTETFYEKGSVFAYRMMQESV